MKDCEGHFEGQFGQFGPPNLVRSCRASLANRLQNELYYIVLSHSHALSDA